MPAGTVAVAGCAAKAAASSTVGAARGGEDDGEQDGGRGRAGEGDREPAAPGARPGEAGAVGLQALAQRERGLDLGGGAADQRDRAALLLERGGELLVVLGHRLELALASGRQGAVGGGCDVGKHAVVVGLGQAHGEGALHRQGRRVADRYSSAQRIGA